MGRVLILLDPHCRLTKPYIDKLHAPRYIDVLGPKQPGKIVGMPGSIPKCLGIDGLDSNGNCDSRNPKRSHRKAIG